MRKVDPDYAESRNVRSLEIRAFESVFSGQDILVHP